MSPTIHMMLDFWRVLKVALLVGCVFAFTVTSTADEREEHIALASKPANPTQTRRSIHGAGFHLTLETKLELDCADESTCEACKVGLVEHFPREAFVDIDQTQELARLGGMGGTELRLISSFVDIEQPSEVSDTCDFAVTWKERKQNNAKRLDRIREARIPFHLRYQTPNENRHGWISIPPPVVCSTCRLVDFSFDSHDAANDECQKQFGQNFKSYATKALTWWNEPQVTTVPVGDPNNTDIVVMATAAVVAAGTLVILAASIR